MIEKHPFILAALSPQGFRASSRPAAVGRRSPCAQVKPYLFVYGTLTQSHPRIHDRLVGPARFVGRGTMAGTFFDLGRYPGAFRDRKRRSRVTGELYVLEGPDIRGRLRALDRNEGGQFRRARVRVRLRNGNQRLAWAYLLAGAPRQRSPASLGSLSSSRGLILALLGSNIALRLRG